MSGKFELYKDKRGEFRFRLKNGRGDTILASEGYVDRSGATNGIESVKKNADLLRRFEKKTSARGLVYFVLKAANHQTIGNSEMFKDEAGADHAIGLVMNAAPLAKIEDQTP